MRISRESPPKPLWAFSAQAYNRVGTFCSTAQTSECRLLLAVLMLFMKLWNNKNTSLAENDLGFWSTEYVCSPWRPRWGKFNSSQMNQIKRVGQHLEAMKEEEAEGSGRSGGRSQGVVEVFCFLVEAKKRSWETHQLIFLNENLDNGKGSRPGRWDYFNFSPSEIYWTNRDVEKQADDV